MTIPPPAPPINGRGDPTTIRRLYGRRSGHKLRQGQAALVEELLPAISLPEEGPIDSVRLFGTERPMHFEIGFGSGEHLAYRADLLPDHGFIDRKSDGSGKSVSVRVDRGGGRMHKKKKTTYKTHQ